MRITEFVPAIRRAAAALAAVMLASLAAGCSSDRLFGSEQASASASGAPAQSSPSVTSRLADTFFPKQPQPTAAEKLAAVSNIADSVCPPVDVRMGASTLTVPP